MSATFGGLFSEDILGCLTNAGDDSCQGMRRSKCWTHKKGSLNQINIPLLKEEANDKRYHMLSPSRLFLAFRVFPNVRS